MHHFIFPTKDSWISSGSSNVTGETFRNQNFGKDQILELKKHFYNLSFDHPSRLLLQFNLNETNNSLSKSIADGDISSTAKFYLRLYEAEGNKEQSSNYGITGHAVSQSWDEGRGKFFSDPQVKDGVSWTYKHSETDGNEWITGSDSVPFTNKTTGSVGSMVDGGGNWYTGSTAGLDVIPFIEFSIPIRPGVEFTSIKYGNSFSLFFAFIGARSLRAPHFESAGAKKKLFFRVNLIAH